MYKVLKLDAADIFNKLYSELAIKNNQKFNINTKYNDEFSTLFKCTMGLSLDIEYFKEINKDLIKKEIINGKEYSYMIDIISVSFIRTSHLYEEKYTDYKDKSVIYVKRGLDIKYKELKTKLKNGVYIENDEILAVTVGKEIKRVNEIVSKSEYFSYKNNKYHLRKNDKNDINSEELRDKLYKDGFKIYINGLPIKYVRYKRSASDARDGNCLFINQKYYEDMINWTYLDKLIREDELVKKYKVESEAYAALSLSTIIKTIKINPKNILIMEDEVSTFEDECVNVDIVNNELVTKREKVKIKNIIWDGQGLLDSSVFKDNDLTNKGMMLLRNRFFKCCAFNTNLEKWFNDNNITKISQLKGFTLAKDVKDVKLIITKSSLKFLKFSDSKKTNDKNAKVIFDDLVTDKWMNLSSDNFGLIKYDKPTHYFKGHLVQTSYQLINTLALNKKDVRKLVMPYEEYVKAIKRDSSVLFYHLNQRMHDKEMHDENSDYVESDYSYFNYKLKIGYEMLKKVDDFSLAHIYSDLVEDTCDSIKKRALKGKILIDGTYATIFGNGYEMLLNSINKFDINNEPIISGTDVMCTMFKNNEKLVGCRSPHITMGNLLIAKNVIKDEYKKYFNLSKEIICVNAINNNIQQRLNGMDYDSDTLLVTNNSYIYSGAKTSYDNFLVPVNSAIPEAVDDNDVSKIDHNISLSQVGAITNLSQKLNSILWDKYYNNENIDDIYNDICKLAVLSGMEIDRAKRNYDVNTKNELDKIKNKYSAYDKPSFMNDNQKKEKIYNTAMEHLTNINFGGKGKNKIDIENIINNPIDLLFDEEIINNLKDKIEKVNNELIAIKNKNFRKKELQNNYIDFDNSLNNFYNEIKDILTNNNVIIFLKGKYVTEDKLWPLLYAILRSDKENGKCKVKAIFRASNGVPKLVFGDDIKNNDKNSSIKLFNRTFVKIYSDNNGNENL